MQNSCVVIIPARGEAKEFLKNIKLFHGNHLLLIVLRLL